MNSVEVDERLMFGIIELYLTYNVYILQKWMKWKQIFIVINICTESIVLVYKNKYQIKVIRNKWKKRFCYC